MIITDGKRTIEIIARIWEDGPGYGPDESADLFVDSSFTSNDGMVTWEVPDVQDVIDYANDWENGDDWPTAEVLNDPEVEEAVKYEISNRAVWINEI